MIDDEQVEITSPSLVSPSSHPPLSSSRAWFTNIKWQPNLPHHGVIGEYVSLSLPTEISHCCDANVIAIELKIHLSAFVGSRALRTTRDAIRLSLYSLGLVVWIPSFCLSRNST